MRFQLLDIVPHAPHPVTGEIISRARAPRRVVETAVLAERLGLDSYAIGERHAGQFVSSAPTVLLGALAQATERILLSTGVTVLSLLDPVRVAEDYATIDQLSGGRLEIVIGKGNEDKHFPLFGLDIAHQYDYLTENYELLRRLLREEDVSWRGTHRAGLDGATTFPRPFDGPFRIWHGSATSTAAVDLAAKWGDPIFSANALQPRENYLVLIDRYREQLVAQRPRPVARLRRIGFRRPVPRRHRRSRRSASTARSTRASPRGCAHCTRGHPARARRRRSPPSRRPSRTGRRWSAPRSGWRRRSSTTTRAYRHDVQSVSINPVLPYEQQQEVLTRFAEEVVPLVRREVPSTTLWGPQDAGRAKGFTATEG